MSKIPPPRATWHGLTRGCGQCGDAVLSFQLENGAILRLTLSGSERATLASVLAEGAELGVSPQVVCRRCGSHPASSSGNPQVEGSSR